MPDQNDRISKARAQLFRYLAYRARTGSEAYAYLLRKGYDEQESRTAIKALQEMGYLDDETFTRDFISYRKAWNYGPRRIRHELVKKGVEKRTVEDHLASEINDEDELNAIRTLLDKRVPDSRLTDKRWLARQAAFLQRRGFRDRLIMTALKDYSFSE